MFALCIITILIVSGVLYYNFDPEESVFFPKCPFQLLTGLECPGCGSQRAIHALLHLDILSAFQYNALLIISIPYILLLLIAKITSIPFRKRQEKVVTYPPLEGGAEGGISIPCFSHFATTIQHPGIIWSYCGIVLIFWITRNIFGY